MTYLTKTSLNEKELENCVLVYYKTWEKLISRMFTEENFKKFTKYYLQQTLLFANHIVLAIDEENNNKLVGFLFSTKKNNQIYTNPLTIFIGNLKIALSLLNIKKPYSAISFIKSYFKRTKKIKQNTNTSDSSMGILAVLPEIQGQGIGCDIVNKFLNSAKADNISKIYLFTNDYHSYPDFFENLGFSKDCKFTDEHGTYLKGDLVMGFIYKIIL